MSNGVQSIVIRVMRALFRGFRLPPGFRLEPFSSVYTREGDVYAVVVPRDVQQVMEGGDFRVHDSKVGELMLQRYRLAIRSAKHGRQINDYNNDKSVSQG